MREFSIGVCLGLGLLAVGCFSEPDTAHNGWYDRSKTHSEQRGEFVDGYIDQGVSELNAKKSWEKDQMIGNTQGSWEGEKLHGEDLDRLIGP